MFVIILLSTYRLTTISSLCDTQVLQSADLEENKTPCFEWKAGRKSYTKGIWISKTPIWIKCREYQVRSVFTSKKNGTTNLIACNK